MGGPQGLGSELGLVPAASGVRAHVLGERNRVLQAGGLVPVGQGACSLFDLNAWYHFGGVQLKLIRNEAGTRRAASQPPALEVSRFCTNNLHLAFRVPHKRYFTEPSRDSSRLD